jgi:hypothetical protein
MRITTIASLALGLSLVACRGGGAGGGPDAGGGGGSDSGVDPDGAPIDAPAGPPRIQDVQSDKMPAGTGVKLKGVVVTAIDAFGARTGDMWIEDPAGGAFSGVKVFGAPLDQVALLAPGDVIDIEGAVKDEFALTADTSGRKLTELKPASAGSMVITKRGAGTVPAPVIVDAAAISLLDKAGRDAEWEKWEGVLITVINARQTGAFRSFGPGTDQTEFRISGFARVQSVLAALPASTAFGVCYDRITGLGDYFFNDLVLPRSTDDVVAGGAGCRPMSTTVGGVQTQVSPEIADLTNVYVTARDDVGTSRGVWVADALAAETTHGAYVLVGSALAAELAVGATVNVQGTVTEFDVVPTGGVASGDTVTEVSSGTITVVAAPGATLPTPLVTAPATLSDIGAAGEPYEGVLVQVATVKVTAALANGRYELTANDQSKIIMDQEAFVLPALVVGTCYETIMGVMHVQVTDNLRTINPRGLTDLVAGTGCN